MTSTPEAGATRAARRRAGWWLCAALASLYAVTMVRVDFDFAIDGAMRYETLHFLVEHGTPTIPELGEQHDAKFFIGASLAMAPLYLVGRAAQRLLATSADLPQELCLSFYHLVTALGGVALFHLCAALAQPTRTALVVAILYGTATMAWPYAVETQSEPLVATALLWAFCFLVWFRSDGRAGWLVAAGLSAALAILTRPEAVLHGAVLGLYLLHGLRARAAGARAVVRSGAIFAGATALGPIGAVMWNYARYGTPFETGYAGEPFSTPVLVGLYGQLFSTGKGVFFYNPILCLALFGWPGLWRARRAEAATSLAVVGLALVTYSTFWNWAGDASWGPRFLVTVLPFAVLPLAWVPWARCGVALRTAVVGIVAVSICVQALGTFVPIRPDYAYKWDRRQHTVERFLAIGRDDNVLIHYLPSYSPLWQHVRNWRGFETSLRWFPYHESGGRAATPVGVAAACLLALSAAMLARAARRRGG
jgi:hypothetical protein